MTTDNKDIWIKTGYEIFALSGPEGLKIEPLAKKVGKSKSSFYHHFADLELFIHFLLKHHIQQSISIAQKEQTAPNIDPALINILTAHRTDLLFNRQLRIHQNVPLFAETLCQGNKIIGDAFKTAWARDLNLQLSPKQLAGVFALAIENFYLQINADNLHYEWLSAYFSNLKSITNKFV